MTLAAWHRIALGVPNRNQRFTFDATGQPPFHGTRALVSVAHVAHKTLDIPSIGCFPWFQWDFWMQKDPQIQQCFSTLSKSQGACRLSEKFEVSPFGTDWHLEFGCLLRQVKITAQTTVMLSVQDFSNTLQTIYKYPTKESFIYSPSLTAYQTQSTKSSFLPFRRTL